MRVLRSGARGALVSPSAVLYALLLHVVAALRWLYRHGTDIAVLFGAVNLAWKMLPIERRAAFEKRSPRLANFLRASCALFIDIDKARRAVQAALQNEQWRADPFAGEQFPGTAAAAAAAAATPPVAIEPALATPAQAGTASEPGAPSAKEPTS